MGELRHDCLAGRLIREKHPDRGQVCGPVAHTDVPPVDDSRDLSFMDKDVPGMQIAMYPGPVDIDGSLDAFIPLLPDGLRDQVCLRFYSF